MNNAEAVLSVKFNSTHSPEELMSVCQEDLEGFRAVPGLLQKYYIAEQSTDAISGIYIFENRSARAAFWSSQMAKNIPVRYGVIPETLRVEQYDMAMVLNDVLVESGNDAAPEDGTKDIIMHHLTSFRNNDLDAVVSDYTAGSMLITREATFKGPEEIRSFFAGLMVHFPKQASNFELDQIVTGDELAYIVWHATTPTLDVRMGTDTFILKEGKIVLQTFAGEMTFK